MNINPSFEKLITPLLPEELAGLEASLVADGCRDPLVTWNDTLLDGHHRFAICQRLSIKFTTIAITLPDGEAAMDWIDHNQLSRRNLPPHLMSLLRGRIYNRRKTVGHGAGSAGQNEPQNTAAKVALETGVSEATIKRDGKLATEVEADPQLQAAVKDRTEFKRVRRNKKEAQREKRRKTNARKVAVTADIATIETAFPAIVIDPPWDFCDEGDADQFGRGKPDYAVMSIEQIKALPVPKLSDIDCHLYLWITNRSLPKGFTLLEIWGFRFITVLTWPKPSFGLGNYFRGQTEHVLFGVKGSQPLKRKNASTLLPAWKRGTGGHSSKPVEFYEFIESCSPGPPYLEMFSRSKRKRKGWTHWGASK